MILMFCLRMLLLYRCFILCSSTNNSCGSGDLVCPGSGYTVTSTQQKSKLLLGWSCPLPLQRVLTLTLACLTMQTMHLQTQVRRLIQLKTHQLGGRQEERSVFLYLFCNLTAFVYLVYLGWNNPILCYVWKAEWKCKGIQALV